MATRENADSDLLPAPRLPGWLAEMVPFRRFRVDVGGRRMHVMCSGRGRPVLALHGNPTWGVLYRGIATALAGESLRLVMPDLVGLGFSDKPEDADVHTLEDHGRWVARLAERLELEDAILVLHDWGGPIGLAAAAERPRLLGGLVVLNTVVGPPKRGFSPTAFHRFARLPVVSTLAFRLLGFPQRFLHLAQSDPTSIRGRVARAYRYPLRGWSRRVAPLALARMVPDSLDHPSIEPLRRCQQVVEAFDGPAAIVWGDADPILGKVRSWVEKLLPRASVTRTEAGHFLQEEVPAEIAAAIRRVAA